MYSFESSYAVLTYMPLASEQTPHIQHFSVFTPRMGGPESSKLCDGYEQKSGMAISFCVIFLSTSFYRCLKIMTLCILRLCFRTPGGFYVLASFKLTVGVE